MLNRLTFSWWSLALAGLCANMISIGIGRFAYVPLFPAMVTAGWVDGGQAGLLGAAALLGYLIGSLAGRGAARGLGVRRTHKGIATTADHIWIARNRGKFIPITRVDSTQPVLFVWSGNDAGLQNKKGTNNAQEVARCSRNGCKCLCFCARTGRARPSRARPSRHACRRRM